MANVSKKDKNMRGIITWSIFADGFLTELCLYINNYFYLEYRKRYKPSRGMGGGAVFWGLLGY